MTFPLPSPTSPHLSPTLQQPAFIPPTPTFPRGVGVGVGNTRQLTNFPHLLHSGNFLSRRKSRLGNFAQVIFLNALTHLTPIGCRKEAIMPGPDPLAVWQDDDAEPGQISVSFE